MKTQKIITTFFLTISLLATASIALAFDSGSSGVDGAFEPTVDTVLSYPEGGIYHFTNINIPSGITVTFSGYGNSAGYILASGDVVIDGDIDMSGEAGGSIGGKGGEPGGYDGGRGGLASIGTGNDGFFGQGPGGGNPGVTSSSSSRACGGGGGGYIHNGSRGGCTESVGGNAYISSNLFPLLGGSGGAGGAGTSSRIGGGGGGGAGSLLLAASGVITINGVIDANGGSSSYPGHNPCYGAGGGGAGGAIRIIATEIAGNGGLRGKAGVGGVSAAYADCKGGKGSDGVIRLEAEQETTFVGSINIEPIISIPQPVFLAALPNIRILSVGGIDAPVTPTGLNDIILPEGLANPTAIAFSTTGLPVGTVIIIAATPRVGQSVHVDSTPVTGTEQNGTAVASINLPDGHNTLFAWATFTVTEQQASALSIYTEGEQVASISVNAEPGKGSMTTFTTVSGKQYTLPSNVAAM